MSNITTDLLRSNVSVLCVVCCTSSERSDPYARYKAQLSSYRRDSSSTMNDFNRTSQSASTTVVTTSVTATTTDVNVSSNVASRQLTPSPKIVTLSHVAVPTVTSTNVTSQQMSASRVVSSNVDTSLATPVVTLSSDNRQQLTLSAPNVSSRLSMQNDTLSDVGKTAGVVSTSVTERQSVPWRRAQQPSSVLNKDSKLGNTASMIRRSVPACFIYLITFL